MLDVFICEDDLVQKNQLEEFIQNYITMSGVDMKIALSTGNPNEIIDYVNKHRTTGLYFLDVDLQAEYNGIILGAEIRKLDKDGFIIFITTHPELTYLTFIHKVAALDYIIKDKFTNMRDKIADCIQVAYSRYITEPEKKKLFQINIEENSFFIEYDDILFFETDVNERKIILYTKNRRVKFYGTLKEIAKLDECLCRCHKSFVVNKNNIAEVNKDEYKIRMINGDVCEVSRRGLKALEM